MKQSQLKSSRKSGFTLVEIMIVVAIIGLLAAIAIPNFVRARQTSQTNACINNLRQMDAALQQYTLEARLASSATYTMVNLMPYIKLNTAGSIPGCPASGTYTVGINVSNAPTCSLSAAPNNHFLP